MTVAPSYSNPADNHIRRRLALLQASLHPAMRGDDDGLFAFSNSFNEFLVDCRKAPSLTNETHELVQTFVNNVSIVTTAMVEVTAASAALNAKLEKEIAHLANVEFRNLSLHDKPIKDCKLSNIYLFHYSRPSPLQRPRKLLTSSNATFGYSHIFTIPTHPRVYAMLLRKSQARPRKISMRGLSMLGDALVGMKSEGHTSRRVSIL